MKGQLRVIPDGVPVIGRGQQFLAVADNADGTPDAYPVVMTHLFSDAALGILLGNIKKVIADELDARGLVRIEPAKKKSPLEI